MDDRSLERYRMENLFFLSYSNKQVGGNEQNRQNKHDDSTPKCSKRLNLGGGCRTWVFSLEMSMFIAEEKNELSHWQRTKVTIFTSKQYAMDKLCMCLTEINKVETKFQGDIVNQEVDNIQWFQMSSLVNIWKDIQQFSMKTQDFSMKCWRVVGV